MHLFTTPAAAIALAARSSTAGTVIVAVIAIVFVGLIVVGSRPSVMAKYRDAADGPDAAAEGSDPPAKRGRR